jgi:hypothetical protein
MASETETFFIDETLLQSVLIILRLYWRQFKCFFTAANFYGSCRICSIYIYIYRLTILGEFYFYVVDFCRYNPFCCFSTSVCCCCCCCLFR